MIFSLTERSEISEITSLPSQQSW